MPRRDVRCESGGVKNRRPTPYVCRIPNRFLGTPKNDRIAIRAWAKRSRAGDSSVLGHLVMHSPMGRVPSTRQISDGFVLGTYFETAAKSDRVAAGLA